MCSSFSFNVLPAAASQVKLHFYRGVTQLPWLHVARSRRCTRNSFRDFDRPRESHCRRVAAVRRSLTTFDRSASLSSSYSLSARCARALLPDFFPVCGFRINPLTVGTRIDSSLQNYSQRAAKRVDGILTIFQFCSDKMPSSGILIVEFYGFNCRIDRRTFIVSV